MIEFAGRLTGAAEKAFVKKNRKTVYIGTLVVLLLALPNVFLIGKIVLRDNAFIYAMLAALLLCAIIVFMPKGKKEYLSMLPQRIYTDKHYIICIADRYSDSRLISDVRQVINHEDFYEIRFPFEKRSDRFICQKSLLTTGSLEEFESLFEGKIVKKTMDDSAT